MRIEVTIKTARKLVQQRLGMGRLVTHGALGNLPMGLVTATAVHLAVLALGLAPLTIDFFMAGIAGNGVIFAVENNLQGLMRLVTGHTGLNGLLLEVRLVTLETLGNVAVLVVVTLLAGLLGMSAGCLDHLSRRTTVAILTDIPQLLGSKHPTGHVRVGVTFKTIDLLGTVGLVMTLGTLGHDLCVVVTQRVVSVNDLMAVATVKTVLAAIFFQRSELLIMTLGTLKHGQGLGCLEIDIQRSTGGWLDGRSSLHLDRRGLGLSCQHVAANHQSKPSHNCQTKTFLN